MSVATTLPPALEPVTSPIRLLIVDDHELTRMGLQLMLKDNPLIQVIGLASAAEEGIVLCQEMQPDVILMDVKMPGTSGISAAQQIKRLLPACRVVMMTSSVNAEDAWEAIQARADAFCRKDISLERLQQLILLVAEGGFWLDPAVAGFVVEKLREEMPLSKGRFQVTDAEVGSRIVELTRREREIVRLVATGKNNKEIAQALNITLHTAKAHLSNIYNKLGVNDRTQVAIKAIQFKIF